MSIALYAACFDASALIKRYMDETGSQELRRYWCAQPTKYTTPFCFYETLSVLKGHRRRGTLTKDHYLRAASDLVAWFGASHSQIYDIEFTRPDVFHDARELAERYDLDLADAFLLMSLQAGYFSVFVGGSISLLVTADEPLANAARHMQLPVWDCMREPEPPK